MGAQMGRTAPLERFRNLSAMTPGFILSGITRLEVIEYSADAFTQSSDAHTLSKYGGNLKTKICDRTQRLYTNCGHNQAYMLRLCIRIVYITK
jgi:hypothetical protein